MLIGTVTGDAETRIRRLTPLDKRCPTEQQSCPYPNENSGQEFVPLCRLVLMGGKMDTLVKVFSGKTIEALGDPRVG